LKITEENNYTNLEINKKKFNDILQNIAEIKEVQTSLKTFFCKYHKACERNL